ncbi:ubl carboxyl-terminal hydrolase 18 isoform X2 [Amia ocellicauda]|uniref:ubl carboxyl-terminal hydrolase 18 isoform X2 n=1 Tax=Amia ocellicauda TaxID=2972642 RepID=UPI003463EAE2
MSTSSVTQDEYGAPGLMGLSNYGLSCCVNSLLQSFSATQEFTELLNRWQMSDTDIPEDCNTPLQLQRLLRKMQSDKSHTAHHEDFLRCLDRNHIQLYVQHDVDEVFLSILNLIQQQISDKELAQEIKQLYKITVEQNLQCQTCFYLTKDTSYFLSLPLPISDCSNTVENCIHCFFELQDITGNFCLCERCGERKPTKQGFKLVSLPNVLCLHLKRSGYSLRSGYTKKLNCEVKFPEVLDFQTILRRDQISESTQEVSWKDVESTFGGSRRCAYMLMYQRRQDKMPQSSN